MTILDSADATILADIDELLAPYALTRHPFLVAWSSGELTREDLRAFAPQFHALVDTWSRLVSSLHSVTPSLETRRDLVTVLTTLEGGTTTPVELWLQTSAALGLARDVVRGTSLDHSTEACINDLQHLCMQSPEAGLAGLYVLTRKMRSICRAAQHGLAHYGIAGGPGERFFDVVGLLAEQQGRTVRRALERELHAAGDYVRDEARDCARAAAVAINGLLHGVAAATR